MKCSAALAIAAVVWLVFGTTAYAADLTVVQVIKVLDGDTIDVAMNEGTTRLRLIGMDSPEVYGGVECYGREASAHAHMLLDGQWVAVATDPSQGTVDHWGRTLAYVFLPDGRNFAEAMIAEGFAREYTFARRYFYSAEFKAAERAAKAQQVGGWSACQWPND